mgnify:CR=1 FL=1
MKQSHIIAIAVTATLLAGFFLYSRPKNPDATPSSIKTIYNQWKAQYNIKVGASEDDYRLKVFTQNYELINKHNSNPAAKYKLGLNSFAHLTNTEFSAVHLGYTKPKTVVAAPSNATGKVCDKAPLTIPDSIDWEAQGKITRVKNQGQCGSCWAFSASGAIEGLLAINTGVTNEFSEQQLVDCSTSYGNEGCNGGFMNLAFNYVAATGIVLEADYPYKGVDQTCNIPTDTPRAHISGYRNVTANSSDSLKSAVAKNPVSVAIQADSSEFQLYKSGVLTGDGCGIELNHGVLAVGYGTQDGTDFWKVKNSWGPSWGANGYILIERRDGPGTCGINMDASYPTHYC